jgi:hypothetical protein
MLLIFVHRSGKPIQAADRWVRVLGAWRHDSPRCGRVWSSPRWLRQACWRWASAGKRRWGGASAPPASSVRGRGTADDRGASAAMRPGRLVDAADHTGGLGGGRGPAALAPRPRPRSLRKHSSSDLSRSLGKCVTSTTSRALCRRPPGLRVLPRPKHPQCPS